MQIFQADQDCETDYGPKGYYNTESRAGTKKSETCEENSYFRLTNPKNSLRATFSSLTISSKKIKTWQRSSILGATRQSWR